MEVWDCWCVNLMVGWKELMYERKLVRDVGPWVHSIKMSSMKRSQVRGRRLCGGWRSICFSREAMKMLAYEGAMRVPMAVPWICR